MPEVSAHLNIIAISKQSKKTAIIFKLDIPIAGETRVGIAEILC